jgi:glycosyltransferase involved in cell wall biosynthesis
MVGTSAGIVVDHDPASLAAGIHQLLDDTVAYRRASRTASQLSIDLSWASIGRRYTRLIQQLASSRATA